MLNFKTRDLERLKIYGLFFIFFMKRDYKRFMVISLRGQADFEI